MDGWLHVSVDVHSGQPYEIKLRKVGDLTDFQGSCLRVSDHFAFVVTLFAW